MKLMTGTVLAIACSAAAFGGEAFDIDFKGGSLAEWVKAVQTASICHWPQFLEAPASQTSSQCGTRCAVLSTISV